jgi:hypothetical protein
MIQSRFRRTSATELDRTVRIDDFADIVDAKEGKHI